MEDTANATKRLTARPALYFVLLVLVNLMWAFQFSGAKIATERLGPATVAFLPMFLATLMLAPLLFFPGLFGVDQHKLPPGGRKHLLRDFVLLALLGSTPAQLCLAWGVKHSLASNASVLTLTIPVLTALLAAFLLGERMTPLRWVSFAMAIAGVLLVSDIDWSSVQLFQRGYLKGNLLIFLSCFGSAFYNSFSKKLLETLSPVKVLVYSFVLTDFFLLVLIVFLEPSSWRELLSLGMPVWLSLGAIAVFSLAVSMVLFFWVIQRIDVIQASLSIYMLPVLGVLISGVTLHEKVTLHLVLGGLLVFVSTFLVTSYEEWQKRREGAGS